jgi:hypothetical protein
VVRADLVPYVFEYWHFLERVKQTTYRQASRGAMMSAINNGSRRDIVPLHIAMIMNTS